MPGYQSTSVLRADQGDIEKTPAELASSPLSGNLKFERADWALFRTVEGLQQKAGVAKSKLRRLVLKELADNALDECGRVRTGELPQGGYFVEDEGRGIDGTPEEIARLFSIARPLISTKLLRLPTRGALGNGLRVVAGAVLASEGSLTVITRDQRIELRPERDGPTSAISSTKVEFPLGTRIEISFGPALPEDKWALSWARMASRLAQGAVYAGRSSPWWYDTPQFQELLYASGTTPVRELIGRLDGCTGAKAGEIVSAANLTRSICRSVTDQQAERLLQAAREAARPVKPERLGAIGADVFPGFAYAKSSGIAEFGSIAPVASIPFAVEVWAEKIVGEEDPSTHLTVCVNRTPVSADIWAARDKRDIDVFGCGLAHTIARAPTDAQFSIVINVTTPYMPITSDGKAPDLSPFLDAMIGATGRALQKAHRPNAGGRASQKDIVLDNLDAAIAAVSGKGKFRFTPRQVLYVVRKIVTDEIGETLTTPHFDAIITDYENEHGENPPDVSGAARHPLPPPSTRNNHPRHVDGRGLQATALDL